MRLQEKVLKLKLDALIAARHATFWQKAITEHGEAKATAFYTHLGLNHLDTKSIEWEGLTLSRQPTEAEKRCVKGIAGAQESAKEKVTNLLLRLRTELVVQGINDLRSLTPAAYHTLILTPSEQSRQDLRERLLKIYRQGRSLVAAELRKQGKQEDVEGFDELDELTDLTNARVANDVQSRLTGAIARFALLGLAGAALIGAVSDELKAGSVSYIDRAATGLANKVINIGRDDEARDSGYGSVEYSAILDQNVCGPCAADDGQTATDENDLTPAPNPDCEGSDYCRCFHVYLFDTVA